MSHSRMLLAKKIEQNHLWLIRQWCIHPVHYSNPAQWYKQLGMRRKRGFGHV